MKKILRSKKGITLVALIVTVIIMLILTGVAVVAVVGVEKIFGKSIEEAIEKTETSMQNTQEQVDDANQLIGIISGEKMPQVDVNEVATQNSTIDGELASYNNPVIPQGFKAINTDSAKWEFSDEDEIEWKSGLVIEDGTNDPVTKGSQFVWVPVEKYSDFHLIEGYRSKTKESLLTLTTGHIIEAGASKTENLPANFNNGRNALLGTIESVAMYKSVEKYGGFYIARFEAGINGIFESTTTDETYKAIQDGSVKPVSKKGVGVWNFVPWSEDAETPGTDGETGNDLSAGAVMLARSMYNNPMINSVNTETTVKSTLCYGVQWDAVLNFIDSKYLTGESAIDSLVRDGTGHGNYSGTLAVAGLNDEYVHNNIYDLAGNLYEWTMEMYPNKNNRVGRGGSYNVAANTSPASRRQYGASVNTEWNNVGFRVALYI